MDGGKTMATETQELISSWRNERLISVQSPDSGTINDVRVVTTELGKYVLRIYHHSDVNRGIREHAVVRWVNQEGLPSVPPISLPNGDTFLLKDGRIVTLLPFVEGEQVQRAKLARAQIEMMGSFLGELHNLLANCPVDGIPPLRIRLEKAETLDGIDHLLRQIEAIEEKTETDRYASHRLETRRDWLRQRAADGTVETDSCDAQPLHGDYQETNVFFARGRVSAVIDWDKINWENDNYGDLLKKPDKDYTRRKRLHAVIEWRKNYYGRTKTDYEKDI